jgi:hypothetical protein
MRLRVPGPPGSPATGRRGLLRALDGVTGSDEPETRLALRDVAAAIEARREDCTPE